MKARRWGGALGRIGILAAVLAAGGCSGTNAWYDPFGMMGGAVEQAAHDSTARDQGQPFRTQSEMSDLRREAGMRGILD